ncbi:leucyl aminopeptidase [Streptacidiphilus jiangxiensis]|uniref:Probable cytosol aminopeptidase n=1 Tax=Streptacidiphilus jiangxiensis TaxID=235985 RepID=A0A1H7WDS1_STRJI|nr:leucyl aminopeptidase [Streptacidiphilus jiangxiensis]SEM19631.1 leucyl aminopeptidase [Streptacidiphilus jiangxiensis]
MAVDAEEFDPIPSWRRPAELAVVASADDTTAGVLGVPLAAGEAPPGPLGLGAADLAAAGFTGRVGETLLVPGRGGRPVVLYGTGPSDVLGMAALRDAAAAFALATSAQARLVMAVPESDRLDAQAAAQALVEGALMARYSFDPIKTEPTDTGVRSLTLVLPDASRADGERGARRGWWMARATLLSRDLANSPPSLLNAERIARCAQELGRETGFGVEVFDQETLRRMGCGGLLGVNAGSVDEARMIKLTYQPSAADGPPRGRLTLVGKGIMYDSGGISLKPADAVHATMKNDMSGAGAILAAMSVLAGLGCRTAVTGYLMCTDNMPSGSATKLGDILWIRGGTTVEVLNTDAEGRLVMADALVLATEEPTDAIVDIATLTGACMRALGAEIAGVFGNAQGLVDQVLDASADVDEPAWQLPLSRRYRAELDSDVADIKNIGGPNGGAIHAALFLEDFVAGRPWAHIDIAGPAQNDRAASWRTKGCTGFGARLLARFALDFSPPTTAESGSAVRGVSEVSR